MTHAKGNEKNIPFPVLTPDSFLQEKTFHQAVACLNTGRLKEAADLFERIIEAGSENSMVH